LGYRHVLRIGKGDPRISCFPPHDNIGKDITELQVRAEHPDADATASLLNSMIEKSGQALSSHPVNIRRRKQGKMTADLIWPWSPGLRPEMEPFHEKFGLKGAVISAVDLIKGIAVLTDMDVIKVAGITGLYDTNYEAKASAALNALKDHDFVFVHVEAADEAGHEKDLDLKIRCIEDLSQRLLRTILEGIEKITEETVLAVLPDHPTPAELGIHTREAVPFAIWDPRKEPDTVTVFDEESAKSGSLGQVEGIAFMRLLVSRQ
jgi:2,3-bisphosphoglycerate-independent phosphoglycerate mutase